MKWKPAAVEAFVFFLALALEKSLAPSTGLSIALFSIAAIAGIALLASLAWNSERVWKAIAGKVSEHITTADIKVSPNYSDAIQEERDKPTDAELLTFAIDDLRDELGTIIGRLEPVIRSNQWSANIDLPSDAYHRHKELISSKSEAVREALSDVYVNADNVNRYVGDRFVKTGYVDQPITPTGLKKKAKDAKTALSGMRPGNEPVNRTGAEILPPQRGMKPLPEEW